MFTRTLQCFFNDSLDSWQTYVAAVKTQNIEQDTLLLKFWPFDEDKSGGIPKTELESNFTSCNQDPDTCNQDPDTCNQDPDTCNQDPDTCSTLGECVQECVQECVSIRNLVVGVRTQEHFMGSVLSSEVPQNCEGMYLIATPTKIINCKGVGAEDLTRKILSLRLHQQNTTLDKIFYVCTDIGEVDVDETEFLLAVTPSEVSVISLYRSCITRSLPFTKIRTYHRDSTYPNTILLEVGRMKDGNRTYSFRSERAGEFITALRDQIKIISNLVEIRRNTIARDHTVNQALVSGLDSANIMAHSECVQADNCSPQSISALVPSQNCIEFEYEKLGANSTKFEYEDLGANSTKFEYEDLGANNSDSCESKDGYNSDSSEFNSFAESISYELPRERSMSDKSDYPSYCTDIYPFVNNSFSSKEFSQERFESGSERRSSGPETNIIYQDVDINPNREPDRKLTGKYFVRRRSRQFSKPTFVSYIVGGSKALEAVCRDRTRHYSEPCQSDIEGSGVYCTLYDPKLLRFTSKQPASRKGDPVYDLLDRDFETKL